MSERTIADLCRRSHEMSRSKGWYDGHEKDQRSIALITLLIQSELSEALEEWRSNRRFDEVYYTYKHDGTVIEVPHGGLKDDAPVEKYKPEGIGVELADVVIRAAQRSGSDAFDLQGAVADFRDRLNGKFTADFEEMLATEMGNLSMAYLVTTPYGGDLFKGKFSVEPLTWVALAVAGVWSFCDQVGVDLWSCIELKERYNATRSHRHGNKKA